MITVKFMPQLRKGQFPAGVTVAAAAEEVGLQLELVCGGRGKCGKCNLEVREEGKEVREVLACQEKLYTDTVVYVPRRLLRTESVILTGSSLGRIKLNPAVEKVFLSAEKLKEHTSDGDFERLKVALNRPKLGHPPMHILREMSSTLRSPRGVTAVFIHDKLVSLEDGDTTPSLYGLAVDIGTTTAAAYMYNLNTGKSVSVVSALNKQTRIGADVMSRILAADTPEGLEKLNALVLETLEELIQQGCAEAGITPADIYLITLVGNSTMQHLFLQLSPHYLGRTPFTSTVLSQVTLLAADHQLPMNSAGRLIFLPLIGGFVGADTTGVLLATGLRRSAKLKLVIDIGTNGEMVVGNKEMLLGCSTAAGPALEGAGIEFGMRGTSGAVEDVTFTEEGMTLKVIGDKKPAGICGSGLVACVAEMLRVGMINNTGRLKSRDEYLASGGNPVLAENLTEVNGKRVLELVPAQKAAEKKSVYLSQGDIRAVQLAKGAIATGINILLEERNIKGEELSEILLAGAFGNYIDVHKGQVMGLIPNFPGVPVRAVGNAAGGGAQKALLTKQFLQEAVRIGEAVTHVELASHPHFQNRFIDALTFPTS